ncbi:DUF1016 domain-containing protein [Clostridium estertheticum]|nr:hypothetical protein [Clostridium estertheticum]WLC83398.1 DUF1016 domain-containing protein [Clostridium estertheticum]
MRREGDKPPIGILFFISKVEIVAEYALGGLSTNIFAKVHTR